LSVVILSLAAKVYCVSFANGEFNRLKVILDAVGECCLLVVFMNASQDFTNY